MVIFHSYVSLPEGSQVGEHNSNFTRTYGRYIELVNGIINQRSHNLGAPPGTSAGMMVKRDTLW